MRLNGINTFTFRTMNSILQRIAEDDYVSAQP